MHAHIYISTLDLRIIKYTRYSFFIGARFAMNQTKVGLIKVLMNYKIEVCEKTQNPIVINPLSILMLQPDHGIYVKLIKLT